MISKKELSKILSAYQWKEEEAQAGIHIIDHYKTCYLESRNVYKRDFHSIVLYFVTEKNNYAYEWARIDEARYTTNWFLKHYKVLKTKGKEFKSLSQEINKIEKGVRHYGLDNFSDANLKKLLQKIYDIGSTQYGHAIIPEGLDTLSEQEYLDYIPNVKKADAPEILRILTTPENLSFMEREKLELLKIAKEVAKKHNLKKTINSRNIDKLKKYPELFKKIRKITDEYFWTQNGFVRAIYLDEKYFLGLLADVLKAKKLKDIKAEINKLSNKKTRQAKRIVVINKKYKLNNEAKNFFRFVRHAAWLQDSRKENVQKMVFCIDQILNQVAKRFRVPRRELDDYLVKEIFALISRDKKITKAELARRRNVLFASYVKNNRIVTDLFFGKDALEIRNAFQSKVRQEISAARLHGFVASRGRAVRKIEGKAHIVFNPSKNKFKKGEILVTGMTRPEFVPLMKKAKAVITNEGGITTHAAIVSRELKIPCIIGTKAATDIIKTGDQVELDLEKGLVKIIK